MDWDKLRTFHTVAEAGSFTHAGESLHLSQSAVSRQIGALEDSLRAPLFHRHARGLILTEQGELLYRTVHEVLAKLTMAEARITENRERPEGPLKITTTITFGAVWLASHIKTFIEAYPNIEVSVMLDDGEVNLAMRHADVAVRFSAPRQPDMIQRHLTTMGYNIYAAPQYLKDRRAPETMADLDDHRLIIYGEDSRPPVENMNWLLSAGAATPRKAALRVNNIYAVYSAVRSGLGVAALPSYFSTVAAGLIRVLPDLPSPSLDLYFAYSEEVRQFKRVTVFRDFLLRTLQENSLYPQGPGAAPRAGPPSGA